MKKILFIVVFMVFSAFTFNVMASCNSFNSCTTCAGGTTQKNCCNGVLSFAPNFNGINTNAK